MELYTTVYNEEILLPYMIKFYRERIPNIIINIYDNGSTDNTINIAKDLGCNLFVRDTNNEIRDDLLIEFKDNIWKDSKEDWVIVCDCDEWIDFRPENFTNETIIRCEGYDMVGDGILNPNEITEGVKFILEDKVCIFRPNQIQEIRYHPGAHISSPIGNLVWNSIPVKLFHMKYLSEEFLINKYKGNANRLSNINNKNDWGHHYKWGEDKIRNIYKEAFKNKIKII